MNNIEVISGMKDDISHSQNKKSKVKVCPSFCRSGVNDNIFLIRQREAKISVKALALS